VRGLLGPVFAPFGAPWPTAFPPLSLEGYFWLGQAVLLVVWLFGRPWATDPGGYPDRFSDPYARVPKGPRWLEWWRRLLPDKKQHAAGGFLLGLFSTFATGHFWGALVVTIVLGAEWEVVEAIPLRGFRNAAGRVVKRVGFMSWRDVVADTAGAAPGGLISAAFLFLFRVFR
jgi:hypothetical protein